MFETFLEQWSFLIPLGATIYAIVPLITHRVANHSNLFSNVDESGFEVTYTRDRRPMHYWTYVVGRVAVAAGCWFAWAMWLNDSTFTHWIWFYPAG